VTLRIVTLLALSSVLGACRGQQTADAPVVPIRNMYDQPRYDAQQSSTFFADGRAMRPPVPGAIAREMEPDITIATGRTEDDAAWISEVPESVVARLGGMEPTLARGHERFNIYCGTCHGESGNGKGMISRRAEQLQAIGQSGAFTATDLHLERIRHIPDGQLYATISNGIRTMPAYRQSIPLDDRWAIVAYVRALQLSRATRTAMNTEQPQ
jgi:mono/diheme cytochrome c family protein